jgi:hypothetical protein
VQGLIDWVHHLIFPSAVVHLQVTFEGNKGLFGGAMSLEGGLAGATVTLEGDNTIRANSVDSKIGFAGGMYVGGGAGIEVIVTGRLCGNANTAALGGFAVVSFGGSLVFAEGSEV